MDNKYSIHKNILLSDKIKDNSNLKELSLEELLDLLNKCDKDKKKLQEYKNELKRIYSILDDFMEITNRLQANPTDKSLQSQARDMLIMMGEEVLVKKMTNSNRYFSKYYGDEFYIFDSQVISEEEFEEKLEYADYKAFEDSLTSKDILDLLNALYEENILLQNHRKSSKKFIKEVEEFFEKWGYDTVNFTFMNHFISLLELGNERLIKENKQLKRHMKSARDYLEGGYSKKAKELLKIANNE